MSHATVLQQRLAPRARRIVATLAALWLILGGVLGARHEATVAHAIAANGDVIHAPHLVGAHTGDCSDIHARTEAVDPDDCAIIAAVHAARAGAPRAPLAAAPLLVLSPARFTAAPAPLRASESIYRLAPKTSPPATA